MECLLPSFSVDTWPDWVRRQQQLFVVSVRFARVLCDPLLLPRPCTSLSHTQSFAALSRPLRLLELLLGDCPKRMAHYTITYWCRRSRVHTHCSDGVIFFALYVRRSLGRLSWWARNGNVYLCETRSPVMGGPTSVRYLLGYLPMRQSYFFGCSMRRYFSVCVCAICSRMSPDFAKWILPLAVCPPISPPPKIAQYQTERKRKYLCICDTYSRIRTLLPIVPPTPCNVCVEFVKTTDRVVFNSRDRKF